MSAVSGFRWWTNLPIDPGSIPLVRPDIPAGPHEVPETVPFGAVPGHPEAVTLDYRGSDGYVRE
jgi:hypothetical protein